MKQFNVDKGYIWYDQKFTINGPITQVFKNVCS